jgi:30S ribosomal protein S31
MRPRCLQARTASKVRHFFNQPERAIMGKGDKKTRRGKIFKGSYGKARPHSVKKKSAGRAKPALKKG